MSVDPKILIVEDEAPIREGLRQKLTAEGFRVSAVETVAEPEEGFSSLLRQPVGGQENRQGAVGAWDFGLPRPGSPRRDDLIGGG